MVKAKKPLPKKKSTRKADDDVVVIDNADDECTLERIWNKQKYANLCAADDAVTSRKLASALIVLTSFEVNNDVC